MKRTIAILIVLALVLNVTAFAGLDSKKAAYQGGATKDKDFPGAKDAVVGILNTSDERELKFEYHSTRSPGFIRYPTSSSSISSMEQKAGRRVGAAIATAILLSPVGLFLLFSKKRKHFVTIGYKGPEGTDQVAVFELGKNIVRTTLPVSRREPGRKIEYLGRGSEKVEQR